MLMSGSKAGLQSLLNTTVNYLHQIDLQLAASKCVCFGVVKRSKSWVPTDPALTIGTTPVRMAGVDEELRYLGGYFTLAEGLNNKRHCSDVTTAAEQIGKLPLKPRQKLELLVRYVIPAFVHMLMVDPPSLNTLRKIDLEIRKEVKHYFHLPTSITNSVVYCRKLDGGLGVPKLEDMCGIGRLMSHCRARKINDTVIQSILDLGRKEPVT